MPATVEIRSWHGATPTTSVTVTGSVPVVFKTADNDTNDTNNPIIVPTSGGPNRSWAKNLRLHATVTPDGSITNLKWFTDGANGFGTGITLRAKTTATYLDPISNAATALTSSADAFSYTAGSPLTVAGSLTNPSTGAFGDYVQLQMEAATTVVGDGNITTPSEIGTFVWDET